MGDVDEGDSKLLVHLFQLHLHVFAHLRVEGGEGSSSNSTSGSLTMALGDGNTLLLSAGEESTSRSS